MSTLKKGDRVLLSTEGLRESAVTNLGASKLAPRSIGPFTVLKAIGDAYTLDIPSSLRLHPTFYVGRLKKNRPATLHGLAPSSKSKAHRSTFRLALLDAPATSDAAAYQPVRAQEHSVPGSASVQAARGSTVESHWLFSQPAHLDQGQLQLSAGHRRPCSEPRLHRLMQPGRHQYHREGPPPLMDAEGQKSWIVKRLLGHEDPRRETKLTRLHERAIKTARKYRVRGSIIHPRRIRGGRALRFFETFQTSFGFTSPCIRLVQIWSTT
uniref:Tf2-1-like SH3-like domain-containing protein n=1 Tax=Peronospora matthiolae TaxID=2874970 RepID=A0AAV1TLX1_9STRA